MKIAEYPQRTCRETIWNGDIAHACELFLGHAGPDATSRWPESVRLRDEWEAAHPGWEKESTGTGTIWADQKPGGADPE